MCEAGRRVANGRSLVIGSSVADAGLLQRAACPWPDAVLAGTSLRSYSTHKDREARVAGANIFFLPSVYLASADVIHRQLLQDVSP